MASGLSILALSGGLVLSQVNVHADTGTTTPDQTQTTLVTKSAVDEANTTNSNAINSNAKSSTVLDSPQTPSTKVITDNNKVDSNSLVTSQSGSTQAPASQASSASGVNSQQATNGADGGTKNEPATLATSISNNAATVTAVPKSQSNLELLASPSVTNDDVQQAVEDNLKDSVTVPASYLANANPDGSGPFTAGVNQVIPFNAFGGDGMLTRLLLKSSDGAPWSDNGTAKNAGLLPISENSDQFT
ncbi:SSURE domain-containing protein, partial [Furfurilactobacillus sp. WILCCON 0119]